MLPVPNVLLDCVIFIYYLTHLELFVAFSKVNNQLVSSFKHLYHKTQIICKKETTYKKKQGDFNYALESREDDFS
jgi:hypothetical protein